jgi:hypothetical protein
VEKTITMKEDDRQHSDDDARLDAIASQLREQTVPPVPSELLRAPAPAGEVSAQERGASSSRRVLLASLATAATILLAVWWGWTGVPDNQSAPRHRRIAEQSTSRQDTFRPSDLGVSVVALRQLKPYAKLDRDLDGMEKEIAELNRRVALLDVYRRTESLLAKN